MAGCWRSAAVAEGARDLVIGIGNPLRGDDGVGWWLARRAEALRPAARVLTVQQLTPELAAELAVARRLLLLDAWWPQGRDAGLQPPGGRATAGTAAAGPSLRRLRCSDGSAEAGAFSHQLDPAQLLAITRWLFGRAPESWQLLVPAYAMPHGAAFSPQLQHQLPKAEAMLLLWGRCGTEPGDTAAVATRRDARRATSHA